MTQEITGDKLRRGYIISNDWQMFVLLAANPFDDFGVELHIEDQQGKRVVRVFRVDDVFHLACDCGKGTLCPEFGSKFATSPNYRKPLKAWAVVAS